jgi:hypothetical protein
MSQILNNINEHIKEGKFYEASQMYKGLIVRYSQNKLDSSCQLTIKGIKTMFQHSKLVLSSELATTLVRDVFTKLKIPLDRKISLGPNKEMTSLQLILEIVRLYTNYKQKQALNDDELEAYTDFLRHAVKYTANYRQENIAGEKQEDEQGEPVLHFELAKTYQQCKEYKKSSSQYLKITEPVAFAEMLYEWAKEAEKQSGNNREYDLFITRALLQLLSNGPARVSEANTLFKEYTSLYEKDTGKELKSPLIHFDRFLLLAAERKNAALFNHLEKSYETVLKRDPKFKSLLKQVADKIFGIKKGDDSMLGMINSLMDSFMRDSRSQPSNSHSNNVLSLDDMVD